MLTTTPVTPASPGTSSAAVQMASTADGCSRPVEGAQPPPRRTTTARTSQAAPTSASGAPTRGRVTSARTRAKEVVELETGEVRMVEMAEPPPRHGDPFTMSFNGDMMLFASSPAARSLTGVHWHVWTALCNMMDYNNVLHLNIAHLARQLGRDRPTVSRAISHLETTGLVRRAADPRDPSRTVLAVNAHLAYRGRVGDRRRTVQEQTWAASGAQLSVATPKRSSRHEAA
ncbi:MAG: MarR family transcriptional regulator [Dermatophilaceae bacterium]|nr:MarR family transcriptional regulator [Dermatophilaceae bacterium]